MMSEENPSPTPQHSFEELDLMIPDMDTESAEAQVKAILEGLPGIHGVRLMQRGAFIRYDAGTMNHEQICTTIRNGGFRASTFQDSKTGKTGVSSQ